MNEFEMFFEKFLGKLSKGTIFRINGVEKRVKAAIHLISVNYLPNNGDYYKVVFDDESFLLVLPGEKETYYADKLVGEIKEISDNDIGNKEYLTYLGKEYKLADKDDYQLVLSLITGSPLEIEGECKFCDYFPSDGSKEYLSLGWLSRTGKRADIWCKLLDIKEIEI